MTSVFLSYSREDLAVTRQLAVSLEEEGCEVWWDLEGLRGGTYFTQAIAKALDRASCVVVLWSVESVKSRWVEAEAYHAWETDKLISLRLTEGLRLPVPFNLMHAPTLPVSTSRRNAGIPKSFVSRLADDIRAIESKSKLAGSDAQAITSRSLGQMHEQTGSDGGSSTPNSNQLLSRAGEAENLSADDHAKAVLKNKTEPQGTASDVPSDIAARPQLARAERDLPEVTEWKQKPSIQGPAPIKDQRAVYPESGSETKPLFRRYGALGLVLLAVVSVLVGFMAWQREFGVKLREPAEKDHVHNLPPLSASVITLAAAGDSAAGEQKVAVCTACHGPNGNSLVPTWPKLAGQHATYIVKQLLDFKSGFRENGQMSPQVQPLTETDFADIAAYYAVQIRVRGSADPTAGETGKRLYESGFPALRENIACVSCHGPVAEGDADRGIPNLRWQHAQYLQDRMANLSASSGKGVVAEAHAILARSIPLSYHF